MSQIAWWRIEALYSNLEDETYGLLLKKNLEAIKDIEDKLEADANWPKFCYRSELEGNQDPTTKCSLGDGVMVPPAIISPVKTIEA